MFNSNKLLNKFQVSSEILAILVSLYCSIILNNSFWLNVYKISNKLNTNKSIFILSILITVILLQIFIINLTLWSKSAKYLSVIFISTTVIINYFAKNYGVYFDRSMLKNILATDLMEANELLTAGLLTDYFYFAMGPSIILIFFCKIKPIKLFSTLLNKIILSTIIILIICGLILAQFKNLTSVIKYHKEIKYQLLPASFLVSGIRAMLEKKSDLPSINSTMDLEASRSLSRISELPITMILVVGETVRAHNWGISGYARQTTPELAKLPIINFPYVNSCGTNTEVSLPCMFSAFGRNDYNPAKSRAKGSALHLLNKLGIDVTWIDNQSGCKGVCSGLKEIMAKIYDYNNIYCKQTNSCFDEVLIEGMHANISHKQQDQIIILHQLGNHGPAYFKRYPEKFNKFVPICQSHDLTHCNLQEIINSYDNAILYTDYILAKIINNLKNIKSRNFLLIYLSDHGESLGENNIYLHGMPYAIAPKYQKMVPMFFWYSKNFPINHLCLANKATVPADHDHLYHTLLGIFQIKSNTYNKNYDLLAECYKNTIGNKYDKFYK